MRQEQVPSPDAGALVGAVQPTLTRINERPARLSNPVIEEEMIMKPEVTRAGELPPEEDNGIAYLKLPLNAV